MLTCKVGNKIINTVDHGCKEIKKWSKKGILKCPVCDSQMIFKNGMIKIPHFAHKDKKECDYGYWENETKEHHLGKTLIYQWLKKIPDVKNLMLEAWIPETRQRPDLMFKLLKDTYAIEYQCSNTTLEYFLEREKLYNLMGVKTIWIFGVENYKKKRMKAVERYLFDKMQGLYHLDPIQNIFYKNLKHKYYPYWNNSEQKGEISQFILDSDSIFSLDEISRSFFDMHRKYIKYLSELNKINLYKERTKIEYQDTSSEVKTKIIKKVRHNIKKDNRTLCISCDFNNNGYCNNYNRWCYVIINKAKNRNKATTFFDEYTKGLNQKCLIWKRWNNG